MTILLQTLVISFLAGQPVSGEDGRTIRFIDSADSLARRVSLFWLTK